MNVVLIIVKQLAILLLNVVPKVHLGYFKFVLLILNVVMANVLLVPYL